MKMILVLATIHEVNSMTEEHGIIIQSMACTIIHCIRFIMYTQLRMQKIKKLINK
jgi:hypothetical protein